MTHRAAFLPLGPHNGTLLGEKAFKGAVQLSEIIQVGPDPTHLAPSYKGGAWSRGRGSSGRPCGKATVMLLLLRPKGLQELERRRTELSPVPSQGARPCQCLHLGLQIPDGQVMHFCCISQFVALCHMAQETNTGQKFLMLLQREALTQGKQKEGYGVRAGKVEFNGLHWCLVFKRGEMFKCGHFVSSVHDF